ncbi:hypothetical protein P280DRAFT_18573 [Massarina eburnea CBS 473.64]|uniref:Uncharacterized protein n=1 Tax=Massarina eburnea CBS 473.64 TaxID=1395130 RepID=A0A6A6SJF8_9PLEO|nr:hypothetical protein P280DRAFT_18573 [Massarina eburnea CBS 473.64]
MHRCRCLPDRKGLATTASHPEDIFEVATTRFPIMGKLSIPNMGPLRILCFISCFATSMKCHWSADAGCFVTCVTAAAWLAFTAVLVHAGPTFEHESASAGRAAHAMRNRIITC